MCCPSLRPQMGLGSEPTVEGMSTSNLSEHSPVVAVIPRSILIKSYRRKQISLLRGVTLYVAVLEAVVPGCGGCRFLCTEGIVRCTWVSLWAMVEQVAQLV